MDKLKSVIAYFCKKYPYPTELSKARLTKLVYLSDWFSSLLDKKQITNIKWLFNHYGPYVDDVVSLARTDPDFKIIPSTTMYGTDKYLVEFHGEQEQILLTDREKEILDAVIEKTKTMYFNSFIDYVYSTYPVQSKERYSFLDLTKLAEDYRRAKASA